MIVKLPRPAKSLMSVGLDLWGCRISRRYDANKTIVVSGNPRGGTSWLAEALAENPGQLLLWEPLEPSSHAGILETLGISYDHFMPDKPRIQPGTPESALREYLERVFRGDV